MLNNLTPYPANVNKKIKLLVNFWCQVLTLDIRINSKCGNIRLYSPLKDSNRGKAPGSKAIIENAGECQKRSPERNNQFSGASAKITQKNQQVFSSRVFLHRCKKNVKTAH